MSTTVTRNGSPIARGVRKGMLLFILAGPLPAWCDANDDPARLVTYQKVENGKLRTFDFDGSTPFVNPQTGQSDIAAMAFDGAILSFRQISNVGSGTGHITKAMDPDGAAVTRLRLMPADSGAESFRTQINAHHIEPYKSYRFELEFRLDPYWNFAMRPGAGLLWQLKGAPRPGQWGNPSMALNLEGDQLALSIKYPRAAMHAVTWPTAVRWGNGEYMDAPLATRTVVAGIYHRIRIEFHADDRPPQFGGRGRAEAWFDGQPWILYAGPTLHPDQNGPHRIDFGWYQWEGRPNAVRTIDFKTAHLYQLHELR